MKPKVDIGRSKNLTGRQFGRLVVIEPWSKDRNGVKWLCLCCCGHKTIVAAGALTSGNTRSCGCLRVEACERAIFAIEQAIGRTKKHQRKVRARIARAQK